MGNLIIKETAKRIQKYRKQKGYTAEQVAEKAGMHRATYYRYEGGDQKTIKINKLQTIADALDVHLADLIVWEDEKNAPMEGDGLSQEDTMLLKLIQKLDKSQKLMLIAQLETLIKSQEANQ